MSKATACIAQDVQWLKKIENYAVGDKLTRRIGKVDDSNGLFVELEPGVDALVCKSQIPGLAGRELSECFTVGELVVAIIAEIDKENQQVGLNLISPVFSYREYENTELDAWAKEHKEDVLQACRWLDASMKDAPMHESRLEELSTRFGVPRPLKAFLRYVGKNDFFLLPPNNPYSKYPAVGLTTRIEDESYWREFNRSNGAPMPVAEVRSDVSQKLIVVDGSNLLRTFWMRHIAMAIKALEDAGFSPVVFFKASIRRDLEYRYDEYGIAYLRVLLSKRPSGAVIVPPGMPTADFMLMFADAKCLHIVSNDGFQKPVYRAKYEWLSGHIEDSRRVHPLLFTRDTLMMPTLGICRAASDISIVK